MSFVRITSPANFGPREYANTHKTHASRFGVPCRRRSDLEYHHRPRSTVVSTRSHGCITRERRVNRYYDPPTDQFLSVDPDVAETGQPYAFTGDDPLNLVDPLGLSKGGVQGQNPRGTTTAELKDQLAQAEAEVKNLAPGRARSQLQRRIQALRGQINTAPDGSKTGHGEQPGSIRPQPNHSSGVSPSGWGLLGAVVLGVVAAASCAAGQIEICGPAAAGSVSLAGGT
jgi:hypothetical protein